MSHPLLNINVVDQIRLFLTQPRPGRPRGRKTGDYRHLKEKATEMRRRGCSYREIRESLGIPKSTLSGWFEGLLITEEERAALEATKTRNEAKGRAKAVAMIKARHRAARSALVEEAESQIAELAPDHLFVAGVIAYIAEGAKEKPWGKPAMVAFMNSDSRMIQLFLAWLRLLGVPDDQLGFRLSIHETADVAQAHEFWSNVVGVPSEGFYRPTIKKHKPKTVRKNVGDTYHGCLTVSVRKSTNLTRRIEGWFRGIHAQIES